MPTTRAARSRKSSAPRRRRCTKPGAPGSLIRDVLASGVVLHGGAGVLEVGCLDPAGEGVCVDLAEVVEVDVADLVGMRDLDPGDLRVESAEDGHLPVLDADVELALAPRPREGQRDPGQTEHDR